MDLLKPKPNRLKPPHSDQGDRPNRVERYNYVDSARRRLSKGASFAGARKWLQMASPYFECNGLGKWQGGV